MADIVDINIGQTVQTVDIIVQPNLVTVNINQVTGGGGGGNTNLGYTPSPTNGIVTSDTGTDATIPLADATNAGLLTPAEKSKIANSVPYTGANANVDLGEFELKSGQVTLDITPTGTAAVATTKWNDSLGISETTLKGGSVILKNGVDLVARIVNKVTPTTTLTKANYQAVRVSGATGQRLSVELARANSDLNSADTIGLVTETIATNQEGFILTVGQLEGVNTSGSLQSETWADGDVLYLSPTTSGKLTNIKPNGSNGHIIVIGYVEYAHAINGKIYVKIMNGWELDELHNVYINNPTNNEVLVYETSTDLWKNKSLATILGYTPANDLNVVHKTGDETINGIKTFGSNPKIPINYGNSGVGSLIIDNGLGELGVASNYIYPNLTELSYLRGITSSVQTQINSKQATLTSSIFGSFVNALNFKSFLVDNDSVSINDSADSNNAKKITWSLVWTTYLKNKADALYATISNLDLKQDKSLSAYTLIANNTNATANGGNQAFKSLAQQSYTGTIVVTATTSPSGATNHSYSFNQVGKLVTLRINLDWATTGNTVSAIACELPSDCPTPELPTAVSATGDVIVYGTGTLSANRAIVGAMGIMALRIKSSGVYEVVVTRTGASFNKAYYSIQYFTA